MNHLGILSRTAQAASTRLPHLAPLQSRLKLGLASGPWHLWLDHSAFFYAQQVDAASQVMEERLPSGKFLALDSTVSRFSHTLVANEVAKSTDSFLKTIEIQFGDRFRPVHMINTSHLAVALGRPSVLENVGLAANRITGLPLIPGPAIKGLVSTWAFWRGNAKNGDRDDAPPEFRSAFATERNDLLPHTRELTLRILGSDDSHQADAGDILFLGGFPVANDKLKLEVDIVNPHHDASGRPRDPVPSFFLTVASGATWRFHLLASRRADDAPGSPFHYARLLDTAALWLTEALTQVGIGAKTAAGYGRFAPAENSTEASTSASVRTLTTRRTVAAVPSSDYNEAIFKNAVLRLTESKGSWAQLQKEIPKLLKPENAQWLQKFKVATQHKDFKELRHQSWYPK